ncbi:acyl-CoA desaturase [Prosthecobacter sp.]|uniref:acyl-CoA desaturase n=1 Tax=Prosthecobacter sp. TaxID=1965333 RepID=UPI0025D4026B|nr:acyl-CoA desaturase [Prosthecobacter sp.]
MPRKSTLPGHVLVMLRQWLDSDYRPPGWNAVRDLKDGIDWKRCVPFIILHLGCFAVLWVGFSWAALMAALVLYAVRMFAVTAFYHRYFSHRSYRTSRWMQFVFAVLGNTSCQRGPLWWASVHRHHHQHSDEETDAHSPRVRGFLWSHIGWLTSAKNFPTDYSRVRDLEQFPELVFLNRHDQIVPLVYGAFLWGAGALMERYVPGLGTNGPQLFVWGFFISTVVLLHATFFINSLAHVFGSKRFKTSDDSRNSLLLALITLGEGWHNNHHRYAGAARQGFYWWEIDVSYYLLKMLSWVGLIWDLKVVPASVYREARQLKHSDHPGA